MMCAPQNTRRQNVIENLLGVYFGVLEFGPLAIWFGVPIWIWVCKDAWWPFAVAYGLAAMVLPLFCWVSKKLGWI